MKIASFAGAHDVYPQHRSAALRWFTEEAPAAAATPTPKSSLDRFFKKR